MGIIDAINAVDIQSVVWLFMAAGGYWLYKQKNK